MARPRKSKPVIPLTYGDALKCARDAMGWTTPQLAEKTKIDASSITKYETGQQLPPESKNEILEKYLKVSLRKEWEEVKPYWDEYLENRKAKKELDESERQLFRLYDFLTKFFSDLFPDLPELPKELGTPTVSEIIKRLREWLENSQGTLQENTHRQPAASTANLPNVRKFEPQAGDPRVMPEEAYRDSHTARQVRRKRR